jgi:hypothetical protein
MFEWFNKYMKETEELKKDKELKAIKKVNNCEIDENGNVSISARYDNYLCARLFISKESIISHTKDIIVFKDYEDDYNYIPFARAIEYKKNLIGYKRAIIKTFKYYPDNNLWGNIKRDVIEEEIVSEKTPLEVFKLCRSGGYKLIETEEELNEYVSSTLDCNTWCRKKVYNKMKELGLGDGFINQFADLIGNDLNKYHAMIDLANEVTDKDTLMYLYTYKFREE